jgi:SET domain-containing protein
LNLTICKWKPSQNLLQKRSVEEFESFSESQKSLISHYGYLHKEKDFWFLSQENVRFINHSVTPNLVININSDWVKAMKNIKKWEELTQNYSDFEEIRKI